MPRIESTAPRVDRITALRLQLPESRHDTLRRQIHQLAAGSPQRTQHVDILYDTPTQSLARKGLRLILHRGNGGWMQLVTRRMPTASPLVTTPSWECVYANRFDFSHIDDDDVRGQLERPKRLRALIPVAEANFRRQTWTLGAGAVEAHLDRGWIAAAGRRMQVSEITLRLVGGRIDDLFDIAERLGERTPLLPEPDSKAQRGARLFVGAAMAPTKAGAVRLSRDADPREAFRAIALDCLAHLHANHAGATATSDPEYIHQMRVATRRLRAAMRMFRPVLPDDFAAVLMPPLRQLMTVLGRTRDLDVLIAEIIRPVADALPGEPRMADMLAVVTDRLYSARQEAVAFLAGARYARLHLTAGRLLHGSGFGAPREATVADGEAPPNLGSFADRRLRKMQSTVEALAAAARADDPTSLHALRIAIKRLRYAIEFFGALLPGDAGERVVRRLATLQDELGQLNDLANAGAILMACAAEDRDLREAVTLIAGWHGARHAALLEAIPGHLGEARRLRLPRVARGGGKDD